MTFTVDEALRWKLRILADAANDDASCGSAGARKRKIRAGEIGSRDGDGICHACTPEGRCVLLVKILLMNERLYDRAHCINRRLSNVDQARFGADEVLSLPIELHRRTYIEGLFLLFGVVRLEDHTMKQLGERMTGAREERSRHARAFAPRLEQVGLF